MARTQKYPGINLAAVKKFCHACIRTNKERKTDSPYLGLVEENGSFYLVDGFRMVRFRYDLPELDHAEKKEIGAQPSMLRFIEDAYTMADKMGKAGEIELPDLEEVKAAASMNKKQKKDADKLPIPLGGGRIWVNPAYLLDMMQIFPYQRIVCMTGKAYQPILFGCECADGILLPVNPKGMTVEQYNDRLAQFKATLAENNLQSKTSGLKRISKKRAHEEYGISITGASAINRFYLREDECVVDDTGCVRYCPSAENQVEKPQEKPVRRSVKRDNLGQPTSLAQLKKRLTVGAAFEISTFTKELQQRRVIKAQTNAIVSIVPFDANHEITSNGGSWITWGRASDWVFGGGWCAYNPCQSEDAVFFLRLLDTTAEEDERYNTWLTDLEAQRTAEQEQKETDRKAQEQAEKEKQVGDSSIIDAPTGGNAENAVSDADNPIYREYSYDSLAGGPDTACPIDRNVTGGQGPPLADTS